MRTVFIHGFGGAPEHWDDLRAELQSSMHTDVVTLPGRATRATEPGSLSIESAAQEIADKNSSEPVVLIGHSLGTRIATENVHRAPH